MYKFIIYPFLIFILLYAYLDQLSNHMAYTYYYKIKYAINRATHAAAMQIDETALANGIIRIDEEAAIMAAEYLLDMNIDKDAYKLVYFEVINDIGSAPSFHYVNRQWNIDQTIYKPAVIIVIEVSLAHLINMKPSYSWKINGTSEVVSSFN